MGSSGFDDVVWSTPTLAESEGEVESVRRAGALRFTVRHQVYGERWTVRATLCSDDPQITVGAGVVAVENRAGAAWLWPGGTMGLVGLVSEPERPVVMQVRRGRLVRTEGVDEWVAPGSDLSSPVVIELSGGPCSWAEAHATLPAWLPPLAVPAGDVVEIPLPDDTVTGAGVAAGERGVATITGIGRVPIRIQGPTGDVRLDLDFAPPLDELVRRCADSIEATDQQGGFVPGSSDVAAAKLLVLAAAGRREGESFDLLAGTLSDDPDHSPLVAVALGHLVSEGHTDVEALHRRVVGNLADGSGGLVASGLAAILGVPVPHDLARKPMPVGAAWAFARLGAGLPGSRVPPDDLASAADVATLAALGHHLGPGTGPVPPGVVAELAARRLLGTWTDGDPRILAWLLVAAATT